MGNKGVAVYVRKARVGHSIPGVASDVRKKDDDIVILLRSPTRYTILQSLNGYRLPVMRLNTITGQFNRLLSHQDIELWIGAARVFVHLDVRRACTDLDGNPCT